MNIVHIIPNLKKGGAERIVIDIIRALSCKKEVLVKLILFEDKIEYDVDDIKHLIQIVPCKVLLSITKKNIIEVSELQEVLDFFQPNIIHSHLFEAEIVSRSCYFPTAKWFSHSHSRMKSLYNLHLYTISSKRTWTNYFEKRYLLNCYRKNGGNNFIAISEDVKQFLSLVLPKDLLQVYLLQNSIDFHRFLNPNYPSAEKCISTCKLISVGRLDANKNHKLLIDIVNELKKRNFPVHLSIIGEGSLRIDLEKRIAALNLENEATLLGLQENVEDFLWEADIYVHSAISEGFGLTLIEAMASGLPVVSLDGGGNRDLILNAKNGFLIETQDVTKFADQIVNLFQNDKVYKSISENALKFAKQFDINQYVEKLFEIYLKAPLI